MNVLLWIVQIVLSLLSLAGGAYKVLAYEQLAKMPQAAALSRGEWAALGIFEIICGVLLIVPLAMRWHSELTTYAAAALALESFALAVFYARYSLELAATNPLVWVFATGVMAAFVAIGRSARRGGVHEVAGMVRR